MAQVQFKDQTARLSGTVCGWVYQVRYGKQFVRKEQRSTNADREFERECISLIQEGMLNRQGKSVEAMQRVADQYAAIKKAVQRMHQDFKPVFGGRKTEMKDAIVYWYLFKRMPPELAFGLAFGKLR